MPGLASTDGLSAEAIYLKNADDEFRNEWRLSQSLGTDPRLYQELLDIYTDCQEGGWDGYNALPVTSPSVEAALTFMEALPFAFPSPSLGVDPDGQITFEWRRSSNKIVSISVTPDRRLHFASINGSSRLHGSFDFYDEIPPQLLRVISEVMQP